MVNFKYHIEKARKELYSQLDEDITGTDADIDAWCQAVEKKLAIDQANSRFC